jgi:long-chain acyl-CoA synthetase
LALNIGELLASAARSGGEGCALVDLGAEGSPRRELTARELDAMARRVARGLIARGIRRGSAIALLSENSAEVVGAWFGIVYAGCIVVPVAVSSAAPELSHRITHAGCTAVLFDSGRRELAESAAAHAQLAGARVELVPLDVAAHEELPELARFDLAPTSPSDTAMLLYTSGTTALAKGAAISHASLLTHTLALATHALHLTADDRVLGVLPLSHSYGCRMVMLACLYARARMVLVPRFHAERTLKVLHSERITWVPVVPTMLAAWCTNLTVPEPSTLRWVLSAGAPLADALALRAEQRLGVSVRQGYGMTEATFTALNAPPDDRVLGSVGRPSWGVNVRIVDDQGHDLPAGQDGEVLVAGHNVMTRYLHDDDATQSALAGGFMRSGDIGHLDDAGRLWIVDRKKDLVIRGGHNVYPSEVEAALAQHPAVHDVAVIGRPDGYYGEEVVAVVVRKPGSDVTASELIAHAASRVGRTKVPRELAFVAELPLGVSGKVHKRTLRAWLAEGRLTLEKATS